MKIDSEKELWEAFRNQAPTIIVEGDLASKVKKWRVVTKTGWIYAGMGLIFAIAFGLLGFFFGINLLLVFGRDCGPGGTMVLFAIILFAVLLFTIPGLLTTVFSILLALGKLGGICGQLAKYRAKEEWGVLTLTRK